MDAVEAAEARLDVARLVEMGAASAVPETFRFPAVEAVAPVSAGS
jgi:hypothetical protein